MGLDELRVWANMRGKSLNGWASYIGSGNHYPLWNKTSNIDFYNLLHPMTNTRILRMDG